MSADLTDKQDADSQGKAQDGTQSSKKLAAKKSKAAKKRSAKKKGAKKAGKKAGGAGGSGPRPFPAETLQEARRIPQLIRELNGGNPWPPAEVASALGLTAKSNRMWYLSASSRDYGFTIGTRDTDLIALDTLGHSLVYAPTPEEERQALQTAFFNIAVFKSVYEYYKGSSLPDLKYLQNTLESIFKVPPQYHEDFVRIYSEIVLIWRVMESRPENLSEQSKRPDSQKPHSIVVGEPKSKTSPVAFVIMPFVEKTDKYSKGFFDAVLKNLVTPAAVNAGF